MWKFWCTRNTRLQSNICDLLSSPLRISLQKWHGQVTWKDGDFWRDSTDSNCSSQARILPSIRAPSHPQSWPSSQADGGWAREKGCYLIGYDKFLVIWLTWSESGLFEISLFESELSTLDSGRSVEKGYKWTYLDNTKHVKFWLCNTIKF